MTSTVAQYSNRSSSICVSLCVGVCECVQISPCMRACVSMAVYAFLAGRHLWQTKMALYPCCWMSLSFSRAPAAQHSLCPNNSARETRRMVVMTTQSHLSQVTRRVGYGAAEHRCPVLDKGVQITSQNTTITS